MTPLEERIVFGSMLGGDVTTSPPPLMSGDTSPPTPDPSSNPPGGPTPGSNNNDNKCCCCDGNNSSYIKLGDGADPTPPATTGDPIRLFDGLPIIGDTDIQSNGIGGGFGVSRSWTGLNESGPLGNGWSVPQLPYLVVGGGDQFNGEAATGPSGPADDYIALVQGGNSVFTFSIPNPTSSTNDTSLYTSFAPRGAEPLKLTSDGSTMQLTDAVGDVLTFSNVYRRSDGYEMRPAPLDPYADVARGGKVSTSGSGYGQLTGYTGTDGTRVSIQPINSSQQMILTRSGSGASEQYVYQYSTITNSKGASVQVVTSIQFQQWSNNSWQTVNTASYIYYKGDTTDSAGNPVNAADGRLGDLEMAKTTDAQGNVLNQDYYRYYLFSGEANVTSLPSTNNGTNTSTASPVLPAWSTDSADGYPRATGPYQNANNPNADIQVMSGLKMVVQGAAFDRMAAAQPNFRLASDAALMPYVNNYFAYERWDDYAGADGNSGNYSGNSNPLNGSGAAGYNQNSARNWRDYSHLGTRYRVIEEVSQGDGSSTATSGLGATKYEYLENYGGHNQITGDPSIGYDSIDWNTWAMKTTEYLAGPGPTPSQIGTSADNASNWGTHARLITYTNEVGQPLLEDMVSVSQVGQQITSMSIDPNSATVTVNVTGNNAFPNGAKVAIAGVLPEMFDGVFKITSATSSSFTYVLPRNYWSLNTSIPFPYVNVSTPQPGPVMLPVGLATVVTQESLTFFQYDDSGRLTLTAHPSSVLGYDDTEQTGKWLASVSANSGLIGVNQYAGWNFDGQAGVIKQASYGDDIFAANSVPANPGATTQAAMLLGSMHDMPADQAGQADTTVSQDVYVPSAGTYNFSFFATQNASAGELLTAYIDGSPVSVSYDNAQGATIVFANHPASYFQAQASVTLAAGLHLVEFVADGPVSAASPPRAVFITEVSLDQGTGTNLIQDPNFDSPALGSVGAYQFDPEDYPVAASYSMPASVAGFLEATYEQQGLNGTPIKQQDTSWMSNTDANGVTAYFPHQETTYGTVDSTGTVSDARITTHNYNFFLNTNQIQVEAVTDPPISAGQNGTGTSGTTTDVYDQLGNVIWARDANGYFTYNQYDPLTGALLEHIDDADFNKLTTDQQTSFDDIRSLPLTNWSRPTGGLNLVTSYPAHDYRGRPTETIDPNLNVTYMSYVDAHADAAGGFVNEVITYPGWHQIPNSNPATYTTTGPAQVTREYRPAPGAPTGQQTVYDETLTFTPGVEQTPTPSGNEEIDEKTIQSISRDITDNSGQVVEHDTYTSPAGLAYSPSTPYLTGRVQGNNSAAGNYSATIYGFDSLGRQNSVTDPNGTINETVYDYLNRVVSRLVGTTSANLVDVEDDVYDYGLAGDGNLTQVTTHIDSNPAHDRVTLNLYDWRDRLIATKQGALMSGGGNDLANEAVGANAIHRLITLYVLDNAGETTGTYTLAADGVNLNDFAAASAIDAAGFPTVDTSNIRQMSLSSFDDQGRVYKSQQFSINQTTGLSGLSDSQISALPDLYTSTYYDLNGQTIATYAPGGLVTKNAYDGAGREVETYTTDGGALANGGTIPTGWSAAASIANDLVLAQNDTAYDADGNVTETVTRERFHDDAQTGPGSTGPLGYASGDFTSALAAYPFTESSGTTTADASGNGNTGTLVGGVTRGTSGPTGHSLTFDGSTGYVSVPASSEANTQSFTVDAWANWNWLGGAYQNVVGSDVYPTNGFSLLGWTDHTWHATIWGSGSTRADIYGPPIQAGVWTHLALSYDAPSGIMTLYVNGAVAGTAAFSGYQPNVTAPLRIGAAADNTGATNFYFSGGIADVRVFGRALSSQEVGALYGLAPAARVSYAASYYDAADRQTASVDVGTNAGIPWAMPATPPARSASALVTSTGYLADNVQTITINSGTGTFTLSFNNSPATAALSYNASASDVQAALAGLSTIGAGNVSVTGQAGGPYVVRFIGALAGAAQPLLVASGSGVQLTCATTVLGGDNGMANTVTDPRGIVTLTDYGMNGQTLRTIDAFSTGAPVSAHPDQDQTTVYTQDANGDVLTMTAVQPPDGSSPSQATAYVYGVGTGNGSLIFSNSLIGKVEYPDKTTGQPATTSNEQQSFGYDFLGDKITFTDQNGTAHGYTFDVLSRLTADIITSFGPVDPADQTITSLGYNFNDAGLPFQMSSYKQDGTVANQVQNAYNGYGQLTSESQSHLGAVVSGTPSVQYAYSTGDNNSRLTSMTYPNLRVLDYTYALNGLDNAISRVDELSDASGLLQSYLYLGLSTIVQASDGNGISLSYIKQPGDTLASSTGGDPYTGLDQFGRVIDQNWVNTSTGMSTDRFQYGYDQNSNVLYKNNLLNSAESELYHANSGSSGDNNSAYDSLNRLKAFSRGTLLASGNNGTVGLDTISSPSISQNWSLDALGNWSNSPNGNGTFNAQNQVITSGGNTLTYDNNGNTTTDQNGTAYTFDAWNHIATVNGTNRYSYDALGRRIYEGTTGKELYYSTTGNVIEELQDSQAVNQYVWGLMYQNQLVAQDQSMESNGSLDTRFNSTGKETTSITGSTSAAAAGQALQSDGKLVVAGTATVSGTGEFALVRYNPDGTVDSTFGSSGQVLTPFSGLSVTATGIAIQANGQIVVVGHDTSGEIILARYNPNGSLDSTFGTSGQVVDSFDISPTCILIEPSGRIVVGGSVNGDFAVAGFTSGGSEDSSFGASGRTTTNLGGTDSINAMAFEPNGDIVAAGASVVSGSQEFALAIYTAGGALYTSFNGSGYDVIQPPGAGAAYAVAVGPDGQIALAGNSGNNLALIEVIGGYQLGSSLFYSTITINSGYAARATGVAYGPDGKIILGGWTDSSTGHDFVTARILMTSSWPYLAVDSTYGSGGTLITNLGADDLAYSMLLEGNGSISLVGSSGTQFGLARFSGITRRLYAQQDANWNITSWVDTSGNVVQRAVYDPYGNKTILNADWSSLTTMNGVTFDPLHAMYGYQGGRADPISGKVNFQNRDLDTTTGTWIEADPSGYADGASLYASFGDSPVCRTDPSGNDFIAVADRHVYDTAGIYYHYSLEYWKSCDDGPKFELEIYRWIENEKDWDKNANPQKLGSIQLLNKSWRLGAGTVHVSVVHYNDDTANNFVSVYEGSPGVVHDVWDRILENARTYAFGEQNGIAYARHWPNSHYEFAPISSGNNSNTFIRTMVRMAGLPMAELGGWHPGNNSPVPVKNKWGSGVPHV